MALEIGGSNPLTHPKHHSSSFPAASVASLGAADDRARVVRLLGLPRPVQVVAPDVAVTPSGVASLTVISRPRTRAVLLLDWTAVRP